MNEDEHGITPPEVTAMSIERRGPLWWVIIEQGNGDVIKEIELTELERLQLSAMLGMEPGRPSHEHVGFADVTRQPTRPGRLTL